jgi:hypothetical protein
VRIARILSFGGQPRRRRWALESHRLWDKLDGRFLVQRLPAAVIQ